MVKCFAQTTLISNVPKLISKKSQFQRAIGQTKGVLYTLNYSDYEMESGFEIDRYSESMEFLDSREFKVYKKHLVLKVFYSDSCVNWITVQKIEKMTSRVVIHSIPLDLIGEVISREVCILNFADNLADKIVIDFAANRKFWALGAFYDQFKGRKNIGVKCRILISDIKGNIQSDQSLEVLGKSKSADLNWSSMALSDAGKLYALFEDFSLGGNGFLENETKFKRYNSHYQWVIAMDTSIKIGKLMVDGNVLEATVGINELNGNAMLFGYYNNSKGIGMDGYFIGKIENNLWDLRTVEWKDHEIRQLSGLNKFRRNDKPENFFVRQIVPLSNGGWLVVSEQYYESRQMETYYVNGVPQTTTKLFYYYGDVCLQFIQPGGADSILMLRKTQLGAANVAHMFGFGLYVCNNSVNILYNDDEGEIARVMHVKVKKNYTIEKDWLFANENIPGSIVSYEGKQTEYGVYTVPIFRDKQWFWLQVIADDQETSK